MLVDCAIDGLGQYSASPAWASAVRATLAMHRAPKHLIRAQLVLLGSLAGGGAPAGEALERFAAGVELFHLFMLIHDDVMDHATIRRGLPALHVALRQADPAVSWETAGNMAIVVGNALSLLAVRYVSPGAAGPAAEGEAAVGSPLAGSGRASALILEAGLRAGVGQLQDLQGHNALGDDRAALRQELIDKTAFVSFAAPFAAGLLLARPDANPEVALAWGEHAGVAFQAIDDLSDLIAPPLAIGKDALRDLMEGRPSMPLLLLRERAKGADRTFLDSLVGRSAIEIGNRARLDKLVEHSGVLAACAEWIQREVAAAEALANTAGFPFAAREGMRIVERSLLAHLDTLLAAAHRRE